MRPLLAPTYPANQWLRNIEVPRDRQKALPKNGSAATYFHNVGFGEFCCAACFSASGVVEWFRAKITRARLRSSPFWMATFRMRAGCVLRRCTNSIVLNAIVLTIEVEMIDRKALRDGAAKRLVVQAMDELSFESTPLACVAGI